jgi:hypothetical protein
VLWTPPRALAELTTIGLPIRSQSALRPAARQASSISFSGTAIRFGPLWASARSLEIVSPNVTVKGSETITVGLQLGDGSVVCYLRIITHPPDKSPKGWDRNGSELLPLAGVDKSANDDARAAAYGGWQ